MLTRQRSDVKVVVHQRAIIGMTGCCESGARGLALTCQMQVDGKDAAMQRTSVGV